MSAPHIQAGDLRAAITIQRQSTTANAAGDLTGSWSNVATVAASIHSTRGGESVRAQRLSGIEPFDIVVRSSASTRSITTADRLIDRDGRTFNVKWTGDLDGRGRFAWITAEAGGLTHG